MVRGAYLLIVRKGIRNRNSQVITEAFTLLSVVGEVFCKILNNRLAEGLDRERVRQAFERIEAAWIFTPLYKVG